MRSTSVSRYAAARRSSPLRPVVEYVALLLLVLLIFGLGLWLVGERHAARREAQIICEREVRLEIHRRPVLRHVVPLADPCLSLARMRGH